MSFRLLLLVATLASLLAGCVSTGSDDSLERMQRNHSAALQTTA